MRRNLTRARKLSAQKSSEEIQRSNGRERCQIIITEGQITDYKRADTRLQIGQIADNNKGEDTRLQMGKILDY